MLLLKQYYVTDKVGPEISGQKQIFNKLIKERYDEILKLSEAINCGLTYDYKDTNIDYRSFNNFENAFSFFKNTSNGEVRLEQTRKSKRV